MDNRKRVRVLIDDIEFIVVGNDDEKYVNYIASCIDKGIKENMARNKKLTKTEAIILLALNLKDELEDEKKKSVEFRQELKATDDKDNIVKIEKLESEVEKLKKEQKEKDELLEKYKKAEKFSSDRLKEENAKLKETHKKLQSKLSQEANYKREIANLKNNLAAQEKLNFDRNKEIINLRGTIKNLKEEIIKLEK